MLTLFLIVFVDLLGFGIVLPLFPFVAERLGAAPWLITFGGAGVYALAQVIATPLWGRLSDSYGRRPVLMVSMLGAIVGYVMLGLAGSLFWLIVARVVSGLMSGNISAAFAYVADVTTPENRSKGLGMIGAAFGLGFMFGPMIGGFLGGQNPHTVNFMVPAFVSAGLSLTAFLGTLFLLKESLPPEKRRPWSGEGSGSHSPFAAVSGKPVLVSVILAVLIVSTAGTLLQSIFPVWGHDILELSPRDVGMVFFAMGFVGVMVQGGLVGRLARHLGEKKVLYGSAVAQGAGFAAMALATGAASWPLTWLGSALFAMGHASFNTTASSLLTLEAAPQERGAALGALQASSAIGRIIGPASSGAIYSALGHASPYVTGLVLMLPAMLLLSRSHKGDRAHVEPEL